MKVSYPKTKIGMCLRYVGLEIIIAVLYGYEV